MRLAYRESGKTRVILAEDHLILRQSLIGLLEQESSVEIIAEAGNAKDAAQMAARLKPDLVIIDLIMPGTNGIDEIARIKRRRAQTRIIVLTAHNSEEYVRAALDAGADGYLLTEDSYTDLTWAIKNVMNGLRYLSPGVSSPVAAGFRSHKVRLVDTTRTPRMRPGYPDPAGT